MPVSTNLQAALVGGLRATNDERDLPDLTAGTPRRVLVALSGGVDSSACVYLLKKQNYEVEAVVLDLSPAHAPTVAAAQETAGLLGVRLHIVKRHDEFMQHVVLPFCGSYRAGQTPNPCVLCNPAVKFRHILQCADELGFDYIATGHYASIERREADGAYLLKRAGCLPRDQSYMLYRLGQDVLSRLLLPLQHLAKDEVRKIAADANLPCATKPDSQEICFIPDNNYPAYIENLLGKSPVGDFIAPDGKPCGKHRGILHYTVGQRKGLGIALGRPVFIRRIDPDSNRIYLADSGDEYNQEIFLDDCVVQPAWYAAGVARTEAPVRTAAVGGLCTMNNEHDLPDFPAGVARTEASMRTAAVGGLRTMNNEHDLPDFPAGVARTEAPMRTAAVSGLCTMNNEHDLPDFPAGVARMGVKIRSVSQPAPAVVARDGSSAKITFATPQRAPAPGQSAVWYDGDYVTGGGYIRSV